MKCSLCPKDQHSVAWYTVGSRGYCGKHKEDAIAAAKAEGAKNGKWPKDAA